MAFPDIPGYSFIHFSKIQMVICFTINFFLFFSRASLLNESGRKSARETAHSSSGRSTGTVISPPPGALTTYSLTPKLKKRMQTNY